MTLASTKSSWQLAIDGSGDSRIESTERISRAGNVSPVGKMSRITAPAHGCRRGEVKDAKLGVMLRQCFEQRCSVVRVRFNNYSHTEQRAPRSQKFRSKMKGSVRGEVVLKEAYSGPKLKCRVCDGRELFACLCQYTWLVAFAQNFG